MKSTEDTNNKGFFEELYEESKPEPKEMVKEDNEEDDALEEKDEPKEIKLKETKEKESPSDTSEDDIEDAFAVASELIKNKLGYEITGEFEASGKGVLNFVEQIIPKIQEQWGEKFQAEYPEAYELALFLDSGGKVKDFMQSFDGPDYDSISLNEDNTEQLKTIIRANLELKGLASRKIDKYIQVSEDSDDLLSEAKDALEELIEKTKKERDAVLKKQEDLGKEIDFEKDKFSKEVTNLIKEGVVGEFQIPVSDKKSFANFVLENTKRMDDGKFYLVKQLNSKNLEKEMQTLFFDYNKGDLSKFVSAKAANQTASKVKSTLSSTKKMSGLERGTSNGFFSIVK